MAVRVPIFFLVLSVLTTPSLSKDQSISDPCQPSVAPPGEGHIIGKRSADDPGTPHGKFTNCTTSVPSQVAYAKSTEFATHNMPAHGPVDNTGSQTILLSTEEETLPTFKVFETTETSTERSSDTTVDDVSKSSLLPVETRTVFGTMNTPSVQTQTTTDATNTSSIQAKTTMPTPPASPTTRKTTNSSQTLTPNKNSIAITKLTTQHVSEIAVSSKDTSDSFDHELAIIFGSMLGIMLLGLFCFGVFRCYRREKMEFLKTQNNLYSSNL